MRVVLAAVFLASVCVTCGGKMDSQPSGSVVDVTTDYTLAYEVSNGMLVLKSMPKHAP
jgi:hypothetical protein